jgi:hypothetical protein
MPEPSAAAPLLQQDRCSIARFDPPIEMLADHRYLIKFDWDSGFVYVYEKFEEHDHIWWGDQFATIYPNTTVIYPGRFNRSLCEIRFSTSRECVGMCTQDLYPMSMETIPAGS